MAFQVGSLYKTVGWQWPASTSILGLYFWI